jgi:uncharacterized repeat protein (TIGR03803 family)
MKKLKLLLLLCLFAIFNCSAQYSLVYDFNGASGRFPCGTLISVGGFLYGMNSAYDGFGNDGTIFRVKPDGTRDSTLFKFNGLNGGVPIGSLIYDGTYLYGMTASGGSVYNDGTIFKIKPDGTDFTILLEFNGTVTGSDPYASLFSDGTYLYGTTSAGGTNNYGTIFKIRTDGTAFAKLLDFDAYNGKYPRGTLISDGVYLYGTTLDGFLNYGTVFKIKTDGTAFFQIYSFSLADGSGPWCSLFFDGTYLYGTTINGGTASFGTIFKVKPDGTGFVKLLDFNGLVNGRGPQSSLSSDGVFLYGMTRSGGANDFGTIFKIMPDGTGYQKLLDFNGAQTGKNPLYGSLFLDGTYLYGMAEFSGTRDWGALFKILPNGTGFNKVLNFDGVNGSLITASLITDSTFLYGSTRWGGLYGNGTVYKIKPDGTAHTKLLDFNDTVNGKGPSGSLFSDGSYLYGTTEFGGANNDGTIFKVKPDGTGDTAIFAFDSILTGARPNGSLVSGGSNLYGMTRYGGAAGFGTIFKILPDGTGYTKLLDFNGSVNGRNPCGSFIFDGTFLYGMTSYGGFYGNGVIFKILPDGTGYVKLHEFNSTQGRYPLGSLIFDGTYLFGTLSSGPASFLGGALFKILPDGTGYSEIKAFLTSGSDGKNPNGSLFFEGNYLYGTTTHGGAFGYGTLFKIKSNGTSYIKLVDFNDTTSGKNPSGSLISDGTFLYGVTDLGGENDFGTIFKFTNCFAQYSTAYDSTLNTFSLFVDSVTAATAVSYKWDFGDGTTSTLAYPSHVYTVDSIYNVCMKIFTAAGDSCTYCHIIGMDSLGNIIRTSGFILNVINPNLITSLSISSNLDNITIYPNPNNGIFNISISTPIKNASIEVYSSLGALVHKQKILNQESMIELVNQPKGLYFVKIVSDNNIIVLGKS